MQRSRARRRRSRRCARRRPKPCTFCILTNGEAMKGAGMYFRKAAPAGPRRPSSALLQRWRVVSVLFALLVLFLCLGITYYLWLKERRDVQNDVRATFESKTDQAAWRFRQHFEMFEHLLQAEEGLFVASRHVEPDEFRRFVTNLHLPEKFPEIRALGFIAAQPGGARGAMHAVTTMVEPATADNRGALGRDVY